jgi:predicted membrane channel-forming protein YqfA (hemolysin III family)
MELYKDKLELFFKDVKTVDTLMEKIKRTKNNIDYATYSAIIIMVLGAISLAVFRNMSEALRFTILSLVVLFPVISLLLQFSKEGQVKKVIDGYISLIKTDWYSKELMKQYIFICNFIG